MKPIIYAIFMYFAFSNALPPSKQKSYRSDYEYNRKTDAFYKLHIEVTQQMRAKGVCEAEGAQLMVVSNKEDIVQIHAMLKRFPDIGDFVWIGDDGQKHDPAEDSPIIDLTPTNEETTNSWMECEVLTRAGDIEMIPCYRTQPFVCKVSVKDAPYNEICNVYGSDYRYIAAVRSCYRVPRLSMSWDQAYAECRAEGSHLVVINSEAEHLAVKEFLKTAPRIATAKATYFYLAGFRANRPTDGSERVFRTIFNETLQEAGYNEWSTGEPNNYQDEEYCGSIFSSDGKFNDVVCAHFYGFICEKEVPATGAA